jgi:hypothetical protein
MQDWKKGLDALVAETMAFVRAVSPAVAAAKTQGQPAPDVNCDRSDVVISQGSSSQATSEPPPGASLASNEREEFQRRLANFKAHQEKWAREREGYAESMMNRIRLPQTDRLQPNERKTAE